MGSRKILVAGGVLAAALAVGTTAVVASNAPPTLAAVSATRLEQMNVTLEAAGLFAAPSVSRATAERLALHSVPPGVVVRESVLLRFHDAGSVPPIDCLCWAISVTPFATSSGPPGSKRVRDTFAVWFIDAQSGRFVEGVSGS
jgi:hypothetical protein